MKKFILIILIYLITGCSKVLQLKFVNKSTDSIQILNVKNQYIDINDSKLINSNLILFREDWKFFIKKNNITKEYDLKLIQSDEVFKIEEKYHSTPLTIEIGKDVYLVLPNNKRVLLLGLVVSSAKK